MEKSASPVMKKASSVSAIWQHSAKIFLSFGPGVFRPFLFLSSISLVSLDKLL